MSNPLNKPVLLELDKACMWDETEFLMNSAVAGVKTVPVEYYQKVLDVGRALLSKNTSLNHEVNELRGVIADNNHITQHMIGSYSDFVVKLEELLSIDKTVARDRKNAIIAAVKEILHKPPELGPEELEETLSMAEFLEDAKNESANPELDFPDLEADGPGAGPE